MNLLQQQHSLLTKAGRTAVAADAPAAADDGGGAAAAALPGEDVGRMRPGAGLPTPGAAEALQVVDAEEAAMLEALHKVADSQAAAKSGAAELYQLAQHLAAEQQHEREQRRLLDDLAARQDAAQLERVQAALGLRVPLAPPLQPSPVQQAPVAEAPALAAAAGIGQTSRWWR